MGIVKIGYRTSGDGSYSTNSSFAPHVDIAEGEAKTVLGVDSGNELDDQELGDVGCELSMVERQTFNVPYDLYDLPDLKEILSLATWNSCLTDEERFSLSAYLPDMDQQTFQLTMTELLGGSDLFFGSPLKEFFDKLKGGFYPPKVTQVREGLTFLRKKAYYLELGSYHENMLQTFRNMKRVFDQCQSRIIDERLHIWKLTKNHKDMDAFELNAFPMTADLHGKVVEGKAIMIPPSKKMKYIGSQEENTHTLPSAVTNKPNLVAQKTNGKGVLKIKTPGMNSFPANFPNEIPFDSWAPSRPQPKGVLRIAPKVPPVQVEAAQLDERLSMQSSRLSPLAPSMYKRDENNEPPLLYQTLVGRTIDTYRSPELPNYMDQQRVEFKNGTNGLSSNFQKSVRMNKEAKDPLFDTFTNFQEHSLSEGNPRAWNPDNFHPKGGSGSSSLKLKRNAHGMHNDRQNFIRENREPSRISLEPYPVAADYYEAERDMIPVPESLNPTYLRVSAETSELSDVRTEDHEMLTSFDQFERKRDDNCGGQHSLFDSVPVTYKRRKDQAKLNGIDFDLPTVETDYNNRISRETSKHGENAKSLKIRFKK